LTRRPNGFRPGKSGYGPANQTYVRTALALIAVEPMTGIEPAYSAWEAISTGEWASGSELVEVVSVHTLGETSELATHLVANPLRRESEATAALRHSTHP
jgi:hypothetical protein